MEMTALILALEVPAHDALTAADRARVHRAHIKD